jgi:prevent-host-death family protein
MPVRSRTTYTIAEARARLSELLDESADNEVFIARHGKPLAALISVERYDALLDTLEALEE